MPYAVEKVEGKRCYRVVNTETGEEHAKCTTKKNAEAQMRLLYGVEQGWKPTGKKPMPPMKKKGNGAMEMKIEVKEDTEPVAPAPKKTWRQFYAEASKGKKFGSRQEVNEFMREMGKKYKGL